MFTFTITLGVLFEIKNFKSKIITGHNIYNLTFNNSKFLNAEIIPFEPDVVSTTEGKSEMTLRFLSFLKRTKFIRNGNFNQQSKIHCQR